MPEEKIEATKAEVQCRHRVYQRSNIPAMVSQHCDGPQEELKMANVHGLY
jgi:methyl coenzyme M reductase alpha subunit